MPAKDGVKIAAICCFIELVALIYNMKGQSLWAHYHRGSQM